MREPDCFFSFIVPHTTPTPLAQRADAEAQAEAEKQEEEEEQEQEEEHGEEPEPANDAQETVPFLLGALAADDDGGHVGEVPFPTPPPANGGPSLLCPMDTGEDGDGGHAGEGQYTDGVAVDNGGSGGESGVDGGRALLEEAAEGPVENSSDVNPQGKREGQRGLEQKQVDGENEEVLQQAVAISDLAVEAAAPAPGGEAEAGTAPLSLGKHPRSSGDLAGVDGGFGDGGAANGSVAAGAGRNIVDGFDDGSSSGNANKRRRGEEGVIAVDAAVDSTPAAPPAMAASLLQMPPVEPQPTVIAPAAPARPGVLTNGGNEQSTVPREPPNGHGGIDGPGETEPSADQSAGGPVSGSAAAVVSMVVAEEKAANEGHREPVGHGDNGVGGGGMAQPEERLGSVVQEKLPEKSREAGTAKAGGDGALPEVQMPPENGHPPSPSAAAAVALVGAPPPDKMASNRALDIMVREARMRGTTLVYL